MEPKAEAQFSEVFVPKIKVEHDSDTSDCENEKKWNTDPLTEGTVGNEVCMPVIKEEVKCEYLDSNYDHWATKLEEEYLTDSNNEDVSWMTCGVSSSACPTIQNDPQDLCSSDEGTRKQCEKERPYKCSECNRSFIRRQHLQEHERTHTNDRPYSCNICNKSFNQRGVLRRHLRIHTNERPHVCDICNKAFQRSTDLSRHMCIHSREQRYTCNICNKSFCQSGYLGKHRRTHMKEGLYTCDFCSKSFTDSGHLKRHLRIHTKERPYKCKICNKSFTQSGHLNKHQFTHTNKTL